MEEPRRFPGRYRAGISDQAAVTADADRGFVAAYFRPDLRLPATIQRGCGLSRNENRRGRKGGNAAIDDRGARKNSAGIFARRGLELFGLYRCDWISRRQDQRQAVRTIPEGTHLRPARDEGYRLLRARRQGPSFRGLLLGKPARRHDLSRGRPQGRPDLAG